MTEETLSECYSLLRVMPHGAEMRWDDSLSPLYALVLKPLDDSIGKAAVEFAVLNENWRPSPARLREIAAIVASPIPDAEQAYAELIYKAQAVGLHGAPDPRNPNVKLTGPPPMSHPVVAQIVALIGGWEMVCNGEAQMQEGLKKQVRGAHVSIERQWRQEVNRQLTLPKGNRNPVYFQSFAPFELPAWFVPGVTEIEERIPKAIPAPEVTAMPPDVRKMMHRAMAAIPEMPKAKMHKVQSK